MIAPTLGGGQWWADRRWRSGWRVQQHVVTGRHRLLDPRDRQHASGHLGRCLDALEALAPPPEQSELVVLLHGLGRTRRSMRPMARALRQAGHRVAALDYPSTRRPIRAHIAQLRELLAHLQGPRRLSFVTHSLGGIVARGLLDDPPQEVRRVVMCAPPNRGAALARVLSERLGPAFTALMGPAVRELASAPAVGQPTVPFLVVAGSHGPRGLNPLIDGDDDGVVGVEETKLDGMSEHVLVRSLHTFVMAHPAAIDTTLRFLSSPQDGERGNRSG